MYVSSVQFVHWKRLRKKDWIVLEDLAIREWIYDVQDLTASRYDRRTGWIPEDSADVPCKFAQLTVESRQVVSAVLAGVGRTCAGWIYSFRASTGLSANTDDFDVTRPRTQKSKRRDEWWSGQVAPGHRRDRVDWTGCPSWEAGFPEGSHTRRVGRRR